MTFENVKPVLGRVAEVTVGLAYLTAAVLKAQNFNLFIGQILAYQIFSSTSALTTVAFVTLALETFLGLSMVLGSPWRKTVLATGMAMLVFFTAVILYAWQVHNLKDCGCFGKVSMTPPQAIGKNLVFMALTALAWYGLVHRRDEGGLMVFSRARRAVPLLAGLVLCLLVIPQLGGTVSTPGVPAAVDGQTPGDETPATGTGVFSGFRFVSTYGETIELSRGEFLVALLSMTCDHCMATVPELNAFTAETTLPRLVAVCLEPEEGSLADFEGMTGPLFPMHSMGNNMLAWAKVCSGPPPQLLYVRDGAVLHTWKDTMPSYDSLLSVVSELSADTEQSAQ